MPFIPFSPTSPGTADGLPSCFDIPMATVAPENMDGVVSGVVMEGAFQRSKNLLEQKAISSYVMVTPAGVALKIKGKPRRGYVSNNYAVKALESKRKYNLKFIPMSCNAADEAIKEAMILKALDHPNVLAYHEHFTHQFNGLPDPFLCVRLDFAEKGNLQDHILAARNQQQTLDTEFVLDIFLQLISGLRYIHGKGLLHGDIRPGNLLLTDGDVLQLHNFALAPHLPRGAPWACTITGGHRAYAPPEWATSVMPAAPLRPQEAPLPSYDLWGAGCVLSELVTLQLLPDHRLPPHTALASDGARLLALRHEMQSARGGRFKRLSQGLLENDATDRLTATQVLELEQPTLKPKSRLRRIMDKSHELLQPKTSRYQLYTAGYSR